VRGIRRNIYGFTRSHYALRATERCLKLAFEDGEGLLEIVSVGWRTSAVGNVHVDQAEPASGFLARNEDRVSVARRDISKCEETEGTGRS